MTKESEVEELAVDVGCGMKNTQGNGIRLCTNR